MSTIYFGVFRIVSTVMTYISSQQLNELKQLMSNDLGLKYTDEEIEHAGFAVLRFVLSKEMHNALITNEESNEDDK